MKDICRPLFLQVCCSQHGCFPLNEAGKLSAEVRVNRQTENQGEKGHAFSHVCAPECLWKGWDEKSFLYTSGFYMCRQKEQQLSYSIKCPLIYLEDPFHAGICASLFSLPNVSLFLYNHIYNTYIYNSNTTLSPI